MKTHSPHRDRFLFVFILCCHCAVKFLDIPSDGWGERTLPATERDENTESCSAGNLIILDIWSWGGIYNQIYRLIDECNLNFIRTPCSSTVSNPFSVLEMHLKTLQFDSKRMELVRKKSPVHQKRGMERLYAITHSTMARKCCHGVKWHVYDAITIIWICIISISVVQTIRINDAWRSLRVQMIKVDIHAWLNS